MRHARRRQRGLSLPGLLFLLGLAIFFLTIAMKLGPHYIEYFTIKSLMQNLAEDPTLADQGPTGLKSAVAKRLNINHIDYTREKAFKYKKTRKGYEVVVDYQVQDHLFANVDVLLTFHHEVQVDSK